MTVNTEILSGVDFSNPEDAKTALVEALRYLAAGIEASDTVIVGDVTQRRGARELYNGPVLIGYEPDGTFQMTFALRDFYPPPQSR